MRDIVLVGAALAFFAVCVAYVRACNAIVGPEGPERSADTEVEVPVSVGGVQ